MRGELKSKNAKLKIGRTDDLPRVDFDATSVLPDWHWRRDAEEGKGFNRGPRKSSGQVDANGRQWGIHRRISRKEHKDAEAGIMIRSKIRIKRGGRDAGIIRIGPLSEGGRDAGLLLNWGAGSGEMGGLRNAL